jgi:NADH:ubiquinone oxidoreductase subunit 4 (subunit M)
MIQGYITRKPYFVDTVHSKHVFQKISGYIFTTILFISLYIWYLFDLNEDFQFITRFSLIEQYNISLIIGIDGISLCFLLLTTFIMMLC